MKTFVEIGSNCNETLIDLIDDGWRGIMVEPVRELISKIPARENLILENVAVAERTGYMDFYYVKDNDGWGSLIESHHVKIDPSSTAERRVVPTIRFDELMGKHSIEKIDLLKIDAEGYDFKIIMGIDFDKFDICKIQYEHYHMDTIQMQIIDLYLRRAGFIQKSYDTMNNLYEKVG